MFTTLKNMILCERMNRLQLVILAIVSILAVSAQGQEVATTATTTTVETTTTEAATPAAVLTQAEIVRRQELVFRATQSISEGEKAETAGDLNTAASKYSFALDNLSSSDNASAAIQRAREGMVRVSLEQYKIAKANGDAPAAIAALETAAKYDPSNEKVKSALVAIQKTQKNPKKGSLLGNPAVTPELVENVKIIDQLLIEAEQHRLTGQYDVAEARYKKVLTIDRYNAKATEGLNKLTTDKLAYARAAQFQNREDRLTKVEEKWSIPPRRENLTKTTVVAQTAFTRSNQFAINQKLKSMIIKDLVFNDASIEDAANALAAKSKELDIDPAKLGISFIVKPEAVTTAKPFSLNLRNIPMEDALRYITKLADVKFKVEEFAVVIVPLKEETEVLLRRSFNVPPSFFPPPAITTADTGGTGGSRRPPPIVRGGGDTENRTDDVKTLLQDRGVDFKAAQSSAVYYPGSGVLTVTNTQEQLDLIEELVNAGATPTYMIDVQTKLVEIAQRDINELTVNTRVTAPETPVGGQFNFVSANSGLRGSSGFNVGSLDNLLGQGITTTPNLLTVQGHISNAAFSVMFQALSQKRSFDLLSAPSLRVKNGEDATINVSRTFYYPTAFDPAESAAVQTVSTGSGISVGPPIVIPTFPTEFESRDIGVKMKVRPQLGADNRTIDLALFPEVTDFEGFINYGSVIYVAGGDLNNGVTVNDQGIITDTTQGNAYLLSNNEINQPVFNTRRIDTKVFVRDGYTVVLGGLMRDDVQTINDKVPFLGDIPLVGKLFQSKATQSQKKNLLIFVTCRIYLNNGELLNPPASSSPVAAASIGQ